MALNIRSSFEDLQYRLLELHEQGYYYVGESVFVGTSPAGKKVDVKAFHLWEFLLNNDLERIVMLFLDLSMRKAATMVIEGSHVCCDENTNVRFQIDAFKAMRDAADAAKEGGYACGKGITRVVYPKPLFLPMLYRCNLILEGHNLSALCGGGAERRYAEVKKDRLMLENIRQELRDYFELDSWEERANFRDHSPDHDDLTRQICEMSRCLDGLLVIHEDLAEKETADDHMPGSVIQAKQRQRIEDMICVTQNRLRQLVKSAEKETPIANPVHTIALWNLEGRVPENLRFGEMVHIRTQLACMWDDLLRHKPTEESSKKYSLWCQFAGNVERQIWQMDDLLSAKLEEDPVKWEDYLA